MKYNYEERDVSGIYLIKNLVNNKIYIGSSCNLYLRFLDHRAELRHNTHANSHLQNSFNKYGELNFEFRILQLCDIELLTDLEQWYIDVLKPEYNISIEVVYLPPRTKETRLKQSETRKKRFKEGKILPTRTHKIFVYYKDGSFVGEFLTINDACKKIGVSRHKLADTITGRYFQCKGYRAFNEKQDYVEPFEKPSNSNKMKLKRFVLYNLIDANSGEIVLQGTSDDIAQFTKIKRCSLYLYIQYKYKLNKKYYLCRATEKSVALSSDKIGEGCDANTEVNTEITQGFVSPLSVGGE